MLYQLQPLPYLSSVDVTRHDDDKTSPCCDAALRYILDLENNMSTAKKRKGQDTCTDLIFSLTDVIKHIADRTQCTE